MNEGQQSAYMRAAYSASRGEGENACVRGPRNEVVVEITDGDPDFQWECARRVAKMLMDWIYPPSAVPMILHCPDCGERHVDEGDFAARPHHTHACQTCGMVWRPAKQPTVGVRFLPGFKDADNA